jgi:hypothetical protein
LQLQDLLLLQLHVKLAATSSLLSSFLFHAFDLSLADLFCNRIAAAVTFRACIILPEY